MLRISKAGSVTAACVLAMTVCGCANQTMQTASGPMPAYCTGNNIAAGAIIGGLLGGVLGAAIGGGKGAAIGMAAGAGLGGLGGAQADAKCRQIAAENAMNRAIEQKQAALNQQASLGQYQAVDVSETPIEYVSPKDHHHHQVTVTQLKPSAGTANTVVCTTGTSLDTDVEGKTVATSSPKMCRGADGKWTSAT